MRVYFYAMPSAIEFEIDNYGLQLIKEEDIQLGLNAAHIFVKEHDILHAHLKQLRAILDPAGQIWVSWPKKSSKVESEINEHDVRSAGLALGFVDTKKCAVDEIWSGLKFVIRKEFRD